MTSGSRIRTDGCPPCWTALPDVPHRSTCRNGWVGAGAPGGASPRPEPGAGSAGPGAAQRRRLFRQLAGGQSTGRGRRCQTPGQLTPAQPGQREHQDHIAVATRGRWWSASRPTSSRSTVRAAAPPISALARCRGTRRTSAYSCGRQGNCTQTVFHDDATPNASLLRHRSGRHRPGRPEAETQRLETQSIHT